MPDPAPRIAPLEPPHPPEIQAALAKWMPPGAGIEPLALFRTLNVHPELASRMRPLGAGILGPSATVPAEVREVVVHRTCALAGAEYEWGVHAVAFGRPLGFTESQLASAVSGAWTDGCWTPAQAAAFRLADELHATSALTDAAWDQLAAEFSDPQILELIVTAGWYHVIAYVCNGVRVVPEDWAARLPGAAAQGAGALRP